MRIQTDDALAQILWDYNNLEMTLKPADAILILGSNDLRVAKRGAELFLQGFAPRLICSGNVGRLTEGMWNKSEAEIFADEAMRLGVPKNKIIIENKSTNTGENILFTKKLLETLKINIRKVIVVQKPFMLRRAFTTFKKIWPEIEITVNGPIMNYCDYPNQNISKELLINLMVGDTQRIIEYPKMGFQIPQEVPDNVWTAFRELVQRGYTKHLIKEKTIYNEKVNN